MIKLEQGMSRIYDGMEPGYEKDIVGKHLDLVRAEIRAARERGQPFEVTVYTRPRATGPELEEKLQGVGGELPDNLALTDLRPWASVAAWVKRNPDPLVQAWISRYTALTKGEKTGLSNAIRMVTSRTRIKTVGELREASGAALRNPWRVGARHSFNFLQAVVAKPQLGAS